MQTVGELLKQIIETSQTIELGEMLVEQNHCEK